MDAHARDEPAVAAMFIAKGVRFIVCRSSAWVRSLPGNDAPRQPSLREIVNRITANGGERDGFLTGGGPDRPRSGQFGPPRDANRGWRWSPRVPD